MKNVLKKLVMAVCASALVLSLASCGGADKKEGNGAQAADNKSAADNGSGADNAAAPVAGESYDTGMFTVTVPSGWLTVPVADSFDLYDGDNDPTALTLVKDGKEDSDAFDHAFIRITVYDKDTYITGRDWYDDVKDMEPVTVSGFACEVYSCLSSGYPYIMLEGTGDSKDITFSLLTKNDVNSFEYNDADVQTILNSIVVK